MYTGIDGEFVEFTNFSGSPVDMTGWSFSDERRIVGDYSLSAFGEVQPGESVILTESPAEAFRDAWGLSPTSAIIGELGVDTGHNIGRSDEINLYNNIGTLVDRLTYSDENFPGTPRTSGTSAWVTSEGVGQNDPYKWALSVLDDSQSSWSSASGDIGSPASHQDASGPPLPLPPPVVSLPGGMYNDASITVYISTTVPGADIRFTLNGSVPTETSQLYSSPLSMVSLVGTANTISEIVTSGCDGYGEWKAPAGEVFKANVLRARVFKADSIPSKTVSRTYFIDSNMTTRYSMPVVSLITQSDNLFDYETGIYVEGADENYYHRGDEWERDVHIEFIDGHLTGTPSSVTSAFAQDMGMRIHGGYTRCFSRKSLRLYARSEYGASRIDYPVFGDDIPEVPESFKRLILRNGGNECYRTIIRDAFTHELVRNTGMAVLPHRPVIVFINGEYWGIHSLMERFDRFYMSDHYGVDPNEVDIIQNFDGYPEEGNTDAYCEMKCFLQCNDLTDPNTYLATEALINIPNHITYYATEIVIQNGDWPWNNQECWRPRDGSRSWEWLFFDTDEATGSFGGDPSANKLAGTAGETWTAYAFTRLLTSPEYRQAFITRYTDLLNTRFTTDYMLARLAETKSALVPEMPEHILRWQYPPSLSYWDNLVYNELEQWCTNRPAHAWNNLEDYFGLAGRSQLTIDSNNPVWGAVALNTIPVEELPLPWTGTYFKDVPVTVTAVPAPGYRFANWSGTSQTSPEISLYVTENMTITAVFEPEAAPPILKINGTSCVDPPALDIDGDCRVGMYELNALAESWLDPNDLSDLADLADSWLDCGLDWDVVEAGAYVDAGAGLTMELPGGASGTIYYNLDGVDPWAGGGISPSASEYSGPITLTESVVVNARILDGGNWSAMATGTFVVGLPSNTLRITEFMYHPADGGAEFIEIQNVGIESVPLLGVHFAEAITFTFPGDATLAPGEFTVLVRDDDLPLFAFEHPTVPIGGLYDDKLDNDGELVVLSDGAVTTMLSFTYDDEAPWDIEADGLGYSLILIDPEGDPNDPANWQASIPRGGTPGEPGGIEGEREGEGEGGCESECESECGGGGGGGGGAEGPVCFMISPTDAIPGDLVTMTGYDAEGEEYDLSTLIIFESNFHGIGPPSPGYYTLLYIAPDYFTNMEFQDGSVVFTLTEEMLSEDVTVWDFWGVLGDDETEVDFRIAMDDGPWDSVTEAIAEGGTCDFGGGEAGVPACIMISPTDAGPDDEITVTAYDEEGVKVDLSEWTGGVEMNFAGSGEEGFMIFPGDDEMVDGSVVIVLGEGRFNHNQWDFFTWIQGTDLNAWLPVAMPGFSEGAIFDYVPDAIAAGGTCED